MQYENVTFSPGGTVSNTFQLYPLPGQILSGGFAGNNVTLEVQVDVGRAWIKYDTWAVWAAKVFSPGAMFFAFGRLVADVPQVGDQTIVVEFNDATSPPSGSSEFPMSSAEFALLITDETGTGALVFADTPTLVTPILGEASCTTLNGLEFGEGATGFAVSGGTASRTLTVLASCTLDQDLQVSSSPKFAEVTVGNIGLHILDTDASHDLVLKPGSNLSADRALTLTTGDNDRTIDISAANLTVSTFGASLVDDADAATALATLGAAAVGHTHAGVYLPAATKLDDLAAPDDNTDLNATTTAHGLLLKATAPASGLVNVVAIGNGETVYSNKALFDSVNPAAIGTASPGTSLLAARRDHVHDGLPTTSSALATLITDETGSGSLVFATGPTLVTPILGDATFTSLTGTIVDTTTGSAGAEKVSNGNFTGNSTVGWTIGSGWSTAHVFTVSGVTTTPGSGATYTHNGFTYTIRYTYLAGTAPNKSGFLVATASGYPTVPGTLTKASGTGDATVAFSAASADAVYHCTTGTAAVSQTSAGMVTPLVAGEWYLFQFTVVNKSSAAMSLTVTCGGQTLCTVSANGTYKTRFKASSTADLVFTPTSTSRFGIDSVSLKRSNGLIVGTTLLLTGTTGSTPTSGAGTRLMWIPEKSALRAGTVTGVQWDDFNIGQHSLGLGFDTIASGGRSVAIGSSCTASGGNAYAIGDTNTVTADNAVALGLANLVSANEGAAVGSGNEINAIAGGTAVGRGCLVSGQYGVAIGYGVVYSSADYGTAIGSNNNIGEEGNPATGAYSTGIGTQNNVVGNYSTCIGYANYSVTDYTVAVGTSNYLYSLHAFAIGFSNQVDAVDAIAIGNTITNSATLSICVGSSYTNDTHTSSFVAGWGGVIEFVVKAGNAIFGSQTVGVDYLVTFVGNVNSGQFKWLPVSDRFEFQDDIQLIGGESLILVGGNVLVGATAAGTSATNTFAIKNGTPPSTSQADCFQMYSSDFAANNACPTFRTENGTLIQLNQDLVTTASPQFSAMGLGTAATAGSVLTAARTYTATSGASFAFLFTPTLTPTADGTASVYAIGCYPTSGANGYDANILAGFYVEPNINHTSGSNLSTVYGAVFSGYCGSSSAGTIGAWYQVRVGDLVKHASSTEAISELYSLYIDTPTKGNDRNYAVYVVGGICYFGGNIGLGHTTFGNTGTKTFTVANGTEPTTSPADCFQMYSFDQAAGNACPHFRTELGHIIKLYKAGTLTQTFSAADATLGSYTADVENVDYVADTVSLAKVADLNALRVAYENLRAFTEDLAAFTNSLVDKLQALGLVD